MTPQILKSAFARAQGEDGDLEDAGPGEYFAVHVDRVMPPSLPPLEEKRALLAQAYTHEQILKALKSPDVRDFIIKEGGDPVGSSPEDLAKYFRREVDKYAKVIKVGNITAD